jgi:hypothetical protein
VIHALLNMWAGGEAIDSEIKAHIGAIIYRQESASIIINKVSSAYCIIGKSSCHCGSGAFEFFFEIGQEHYHVI